MPPDVRIVKTDILHKKEIYIFSGLGADKRVFRYFDFSDYNVYFVEWISAHKNETIENYARRMISQISHPNPILIGLSFGGIMAIEVATQIQARKVIIIASVKNKKEIPLYYRLIGKLNLHKVIPSDMLKKSNRVTEYLFGTSTAIEKQLFKEILQDTDPLFLEWAVDRIVKWQNVSKVQNLVHIHGTKDRILPLRYVNSNYKIEEGGHLMTLSHAKEIMSILRQEL